MTILHKIAAQKRKEVSEKQQYYPIALLERSMYMDSPVVSLRRYIEHPEKNGIIAEIKRKSPAKGWINQHVQVEKTSIGYMQAGASALSVLTDSEWFGANEDDFKKARDFNFCPLLRKDFIVSEYQVIESRSMGADAILLIAAILNEVEMKSLYALATSFGMEVLFEVHTEEELKTVLALDPHIVGVNARNLNDFTFDKEKQLALVQLIPDSVCRIAESGISSSAEMKQLYESGYDGCLIGTLFMNHTHPEQALRKFIAELPVSSLIQ